MTDYPLASVGGMKEEFLNFRVPELLPGMEACMTNSAPHTDGTMGPNLYMCPEGGYTRIHQDGSGTCDSCHLCLDGYNEIIMLMAGMSERQKMCALNLMGIESLYNDPHSDEWENNCLKWPTTETFEQLKKAG
jgi:hypothetical protein